MTTSQRKERVVDPLRDPRVIAVLDQFQEEVAQATQRAMGRLRQAGFEDPAAVLTGRPGVAR